MSVRVVNENFDPVQNASVWVNDSLGNEVINSTTPADGWIDWIRATEYVQNQSTIVNHTAHNITASNATLTGWAMPEPFMDTNRDVYVLLGGGKGYNIFLHEGWNLVSLPYEPYNMSADNLLDVLKSIDGEWDHIRWWDANDSADPWKTYSPLKPPALNDLHHLNHTMGFWIHTNEDCTLFAMGNPQVSTDITLYAGWNLLGYPTTNRSVNISTAFSGISACRDMPVSGYYEDAPYFIDNYTEDYVMLPGQGYWVHVNATCTWTVDW